jgi:hypothetical protein
MSTQNIRGYFANYYHALNCKSYMTSVGYNWDHVPEVVILGKKLRASVFRGQKPCLIDTSCEKRL